MHSVALDTSRVVWLQLLGYRQLRRSKVAYLIEHEANVRAVTLVSAHSTLRLVWLVQTTISHPSSGTVVGVAVADLYRPRGTCISSPPRQASTT